MKQRLSFHALIYTLVSPFPLFIDLDILVFWSSKRIISDPQLNIQFGNVLQFYLITLCIAAFNCVIFYYITTLNITTIKRYIQRSPERSSYLSIIILTAILWIGIFIYNSALDVAIEMSDVAWFAAKHYAGIALTLMLLIYFDKQTLRKMYQENA